MRNRARTYTPLQLVDMALRHRPNFAPGTGYSYSSANYVLLGILIQRVTGQSWEEQVESRILRPLGMRHTLTPDVTTSLPSPHTLLYQQFVPGGPLVDVTVPALALEMGADLSIISTPADLGTFFRALLGGKLLRPAQLSAMEQTVPEPDADTIVSGTRYGLGLQRYPRPCGGGYWTHGGDGLGYDVEDGVSADGRTSVVVYLDSLTFDRTPFTAQLKAADQLIFDQLCGQR
jgi:D-alanyl-D-alanine carboxypeptidase